MNRVDSCAAAPLSPDEVLRIVEHYCATSPTPVWQRLGHELEAGCLAHSHCDAAAVHAVFMGFAVAEEGEGAQTARRQALMAEQTLFAHLFDAGVACVPVALSLALCPQRPNAERHYFFTAHRRAHDSPFQ